MVGKRRPGLQEKGYVLNRQNSKLDFRWDPYYLLAKDEFHNFWYEYLHSGIHELLYILGHGFDPRMSKGLEAVLTFGGEGSRDCWLISFDEGDESPSKSLIPLAEQNTKRVESLIHKRGNLIYKQVEMWSSSGPYKRRMSSQNAAKILDAISELSKYTDIIVDISAMPRAIYFTLIGKILYLLDQANLKNKNLHVIVCEDAVLDKNIRDIGIDDTASYIHGFGGSSMDTEASANISKVWIPILGESQRTQLERIHTYVNPDEICPILPHPSLEIRRGDRLIVEYRDLLFDQWGVESSNIVYASEQNPFDVYRQIYQLTQKYNRALESIGGCKAAISAQSSKLLSIGALLAAYELRLKRIARVGIVHVEAQGYELIEQMPSISGDLFSLWLEGECYAN